MTAQNPVLRSLGFGAKDRVVVVHVDDIGACEATVSGLGELMHFGLVSSCSVMVPCPAFPQAAAYLAGHPEVDAGAHLTLTCERGPEQERWRPVSTADAARGLLDAGGFFHAEPKSAVEHCVGGAAYEEMRAQLDRAEACGIGVTHLDSHMFAAWHPKIIAEYMRLGGERRLPTLLLRLDDPDCGVNRRGGVFDEDELSQSGRLVREYEEGEGAGVVIFDKLVGLSLRRPKERLAQAVQAFDALPPGGLTHFFIHAARDTEELRALTPDWEARVADFETFTSAALRDHVRSSGVQLIGYRTLRDHVRAAPPADGTPRPGGASR